MTSDLDGRIEAMVLKLIEQSPEPRPGAEVLPHDLRPVARPLRGSLAMALAAVAVLVVGGLGVLFGSVVFDDADGVAVVPGEPAPAHDSTEIPPGQELALLPVEGDPDVAPETVRGDVTAVGRIEETTWEVFRWDTTTTEPLNGTCLQAISHLGTQTACRGPNLPANVIATPLLFAEFDESGAATGFVMIWEVPDGTSYVTSESEAGGVVVFRRWQSPVSGVAGLVAPPNADVTHITAYDASGTPLNGVTVRSSDILGPSPNESVEWSEMSGAVPPRRNHEAVWTGSEMIVLGGTPLDTGPDTPAMETVFSYDPGADSWNQIPDSPHARLGMSAVWTGSEMVVWGGQPFFASDEYSASGAIYDVFERSWRTIPDAPIPGRRYHTAVWTGTEMIVWGGDSPARGPALVDGAAYNPATNAWRAIADAPFPLVPTETTAVWDGLQMIVWSGSEVGESGEFYGRGLTYDITRDVWEEIPEVPIKGGSYRGVWTGDALVVVGGGQPGADGFEALAFEALDREWRALGEPLLGNEFIRWNFEVAWTGTHVVVVGGNRNDVFAPIEHPLLLDPMTGRWVVVEGPVGQRAGHTLVWTEEEILIWGGDEMGYRWRPALTADQ
jgi:hypothetical protein